MLLSNGLAVGGAETQLVGLAEGLAAAGREVIVVSILPSTAFGDRLVAAGIPVHVVGGDRPRALRTLLRTVRLLRATRPDVLVSFIFQANVLGIVAGRLARVPVIVTSLRNERFGSRARHMVLRILLRLGTLAVPNSHTVGDAMVRRGMVSRHRTRVIPNLIELDAAGAASTTRAATRRRLGWADDEVVWICVARLEPQKGHLELLEAFARVLQWEPATRLALVGTGSAHDAVVAAARGVGPRVTVLGLRDDVPELLAAADGLVLASHHEGLPNCVIEAMAAGLPVVATDVGGVPELVEDRVNGRLVPSRDPDALARALRDLTRAAPAERRALGASGAERLAAFGPDVVIGAWLELLDDTHAAVGAPVLELRPSAPDPADGGVTFFLPSFAGGGAQRSVVALADLLVERGWDAELVVARATGPLSGEAGRVAPVVDLRRRGTLRALPALVRHLRSRRPALLLSTLDNANLVALLAARLAGTHIRVALRVANETSWLARHGRGSQRLVYLCARAFFSRADALLAPSSVTARDLERWLRLPSGRVHVVTNPVIDERVLAAGASRPDHPWFAPGAPPVVLGLGRFESHKRFLALLDSFAAARGDTGARLVLLGEGPERTALLERAERLGVAGDVWLPGFEPAPFPFLAHCHVFVTASEVEGLPGALIQALGCGAKVIAVAGAGATDDVLQGGRHGRLVPDAGPSLRDAITAALAEPPGGPGPDACAAYTDSAAADDLEQLVQHMLGRGPHPPDAVPGRRERRAE